MTRRARPRRGTAIVAALAITMLAAALLASAAVVASAGARAAIDERAALVAESAVRGAFAGAVMSWDAAADALAVGQAMQRPLDRPAGDGTALAISGTLAVRRIDTTLFALTADVRVGGDLGLARRRARLLVQRAAVAGPSGVLPPPAPIARWSGSDIY